MSPIWVYSLISVIIVSLISFIGAVMLAINAKKLKKVLVYLISFSVGALFGDAFIHLLPEAASLYGITLKLSLYILSGIIIFFILDKVINWQHCHRQITKEHIHPFAIMNLIGDGMHNFIDGAIIAASYIASFPIGIATTFAVVFHEIPQEIGDFGILLYGGFTKKKALFLNFISALSAVLGAIITLNLYKYINGMTEILIPLAIGAFIYIAGSDLIPELHKELNLGRSLLQLFALLTGILIMYLLAYLG